MIRIRRCHNMSEIDELQRNAQAERNDYTMPVIYTAGRDWWVAYDQEGRAVGYAGMRCSGAYGWLSACYVFRAARRQGIQGRFLTVRLRHARKQGLGTIYTYTVSDNVVSSRNLCRRGFLPAIPPKRHGGRWQGEKGLSYFARAK